MKTVIVSLLVIVALVASAIAAPMPTPTVSAAGEWSMPVNCLSARLLLTLQERKHDGSASTYHYLAIVEFKNMGGEVVAVSSQPSFKGILVADADGKPIRECGYIQDGTVPLPQWAHIPGYNAYLGVRVDMTTVYALAPDSAGDSALLAIDDSVHSLAPGQYSVRGTVAAETDKDGPENQWVGEIKLEPVGFAFKNTLIAVTACHARECRWLCCFAEIQINYRHSRLRYNPTHQSTHATLG